MKASLWFAVLILSSSPSAALSQTPAQLEAKGDSVGARNALARAVQASPNSVPALSAYAEFLERYGDPQAREVYGKLLTALRNSGDTARVEAVSHRLAVLDLMAGDDGAASRVVKFAPAASANPWPTTGIPGPLRPFARMAAISTGALGQELLPALARNIVTNGYQASRNNEALEQTEYLKLVHRYLSQARELEKLAGESKVIRIDNCDSPNAGELLRILGFRMRGGCGSEVVLETVNEPRAFVTTDSGFPINELEAALRTNRPFTYDFHPTQVPVLFGPDYWIPVKEREGNSFIEAFIGDPSVCRLYLGLSKLDPETAQALRKSASLTRLKAYSHVLDFFGGMFELRDGKAVVPGGQRAAGAWADLVGASPDQGAAFFDKLIAKDDGWLASLYDSLARIRGPVQEYLTDPARMKRFYTAVRGRITSPGPARPVFRSNTDMMLFTTRLRLDANGKPHIPGSFEVWRNLFVNHPQGKYDSKITKAASGWKEPDDVLEALFALCRKTVENEPLKIFMAISDIDRGRPKPLEAATVDRMAREYHVYGSQYPLFSESRTLPDKAILQYLDAAAAISKVKDPALHSDLAGTFQSLVGLWQILARQQELPAGQGDQVFSDLVSSFTQIRNERDIFDAGRKGVTLLLGGQVAAAEANERLLDRVAGPATDGDTHEEMVQEMMRVLEAQRIISLDTLLAMGDHIEAIAKGDKMDPKLINKLASRIAEIQLPRASLTAAEKNAMGYGFWTERHIENERRLNLRAAIEKAAGNPENVRETRGLLAPLLRDTLLAFNYAYYAPPGAQILYTNPVFVRSHDFWGMQGTDHTWRPTEMYGTGWPSNGGGRLVGSLSSLPYALAEAEQNFLVPEQTQALIWGDLVPQMILSAKIPRYWRVTPAQLHWTALHVRYGHELIAEAALDPELRKEVSATLGLLAAPARTRQVTALIEQGAVKEALDRVTPSEFFLLARDIGPRRAAESSILLAEMKRMAADSPQELNYDVISREFGSPKPTLANSYEPEMLNLRTFPTLMGYSSRIMAESWESNTIYWAALADEIGVSPPQLDVRIPEWTRKLVEQIFASHLEDWPAVLRSLRGVGDEVRARARTAAAEQKASLQ
ncbi:MAG: hypothetical protein JST11_26665 [Acidobacteria bacterium]|nr:hypothetical protein [Acidobacteriota bacterium]